MESETDRTSTIIDLGNDYFMDASSGDVQKENNIEMIPRGSPDSTGDISSI